MLVFLLEGLWCHATPHLPSSLKKKLWCLLVAMTPLSFAWGSRARASLGPSHGQHLSASRCEGGLPLLAPSVRLFCWRPSSLHARLWYAGLWHGLLDSLWLIVGLVKLATCFQSLFQLPGARRRSLFPPLRKRRLRALALSLCSRARVLDFLLPEELEGRRVPRYFAVTSGGCNHASSDRSDRVRLANVPWGSGFPMLLEFYEHAVSRRNSWLFHTHPAVIFLLHALLGPCLLLELLPLLRCLRDHTWDARASAEAKQELVRWPWSSGAYRWTSARTLSAPLARPDRLFSKFSAPCRASS